MVNQFERIKQEKSPLSVGRDLARYARLGWREIPKDDLERLRIYGLALRPKTPGYFMMRLRVPGGQLEAEQFASVGRIAERFGQDRLDLTTRCQLQLRWLRLEHIPAVIDELKQAGLLTMQTLMDSVRNIVTCPLAGLCPHELIDVRPVIDALEARLVNRPDFVDLPRKVNIAVTGCGGHGCATHTQDIAIIPAQRRTGAGGNQRTLGFAVLVGGKASGNTARPAEPLDIFVSPQEAPQVVTELVRLYRDHGPRDTRGRSRMAHLVEQWGVPRLRRELERAVGRRFDPPEALIDALAEGPGPRSTVGILPVRDPQRVAVGLHVSVGQLTGRDAQAIATLAQRAGDAAIRLTEQQNILLTNVPRSALPALEHEPVLQRYPLDPHPVRAGTQSCTGSTFCALSAIDTKRRARELADELARRFPDWREPVRIAWSGCRAGCGRHIVADIGLLGRRVRGAEGMIEAADVYVAGSADDPVVAGTRVAEAVPCDELADVIERLVRDGTLEAVHNRQRAAGPA